VEAIKNIEEEEMEER